MKRTALARRSPLRPNRRGEPAELTAARPVVAARSGGRCEARTPVCQGAAREVHHRAGRGWPGCHHPDLLLHVCGHGNVDGCHGFIESHGIEAFARGWRLHRDSLEVREYRGQWPPPGAAS